MTVKITPVKLDKTGKVIPRLSSAKVHQWRVTIGRKITGGSKQRHFFKTEHDAKEWINGKLAERKKKGFVAFSMKDGLRVEALECNKRLKEVDTSLTLTQAVDYYIRHALPTGGKKLFGEVAADFLLSRRNIGCKAKTMIQYESYVSVLNDEWCKEMIHQIKRADIEDWISEAEWAPRTRKNYLVTLTTIFNFAIGREYCVDNPVAKIDRPIMDDTVPGILSTEEVKSLLAVTQACYPELVPGIAIGLFAGLRRSELCALDWSEVNMEESFIEVKGRKAKTRTRRLVTISENLQVWLKPYKTSSGPVVSKHSGNGAPQVALGVDMFGEKLKHLVRGRPKTDTDEGRPPVKEPWPHNAIRHSFGSYFYAKSKNENLTAHEMGNSPAMVFKHYRKLVRPKDMEEYWKISPESIAPLPAGQC